MKKISKPKEVWRTLLSEEQYKVCREGGTERAFTGELYSCQEPGTYLCACCRHPLFSSKAKFDSGCGWPSFSQTIDPVAVEYHEDLSHGMNRIEVRCSRCDAHLGHVFDDGPAPKGKRYCINSISLELQRTVENKNE